MDYTVDWHERHMVLHIDGRRWVLRNVQELALMLAAFGRTAGRSAGVNARSARSRKFAADASLSATNSREP